MNGNIRYGICIIIIFINWCLFKLNIIYYNLIISINKWRLLNKFLKNPLSKALKIRLQPKFQLKQENVVTIRSWMLLKLLLPPKSKQVIKNWLFNYIQINVKTLMLRRSLCKFKKLTKYYLMLMRELGMIIIKNKFYTINIKWLLKSLICRHLDLILISILILNVSKSSQIIQETSMQFIEKYLN